MSKCYNCAHHSICVIRQTLVMHPEVEASIKACQHYSGKADSKPAYNETPDFKFEMPPFTPPAAKKVPQVKVVSTEKIEDKPVDEVVKSTAPVVHETIQPQAQAAPPIFDSLSEMSREEVQNRALNMDATKINDLSSRIHALQETRNRQDIVRKNFALTAEDDGTVSV